MGRRWWWKTRAGTKKLVCMNCRRRWLVSMQVNDRYKSWSEFHRKVGRKCDKYCLTEGEDDVDRSNAER